MAAAYDLHEMTALWVARCSSLASCTGSPMAIRKSPARRRKGGSLNCAGRAGEYPWSSAGAHLTEKDEYGILDLVWWQRKGCANWEAHLEIEGHQPVAILRAYTYAGRPFGDESFVREMGDRFGRQQQLVTLRQALRLFPFPQSDQVFESAFLPHP